MPAALEDWQPYQQLTGPFRLEHEDGEQVAYAESGIARGFEKVAQAWNPADIELVLYNELRKEIGAVRGHKVIRFETDQSPVTVVIVDDSIPAESGSSVQTRGSQPPGTPG